MENKYTELDNYGREIVLSIFPKQTLVAGTPSDRYDLSGTTVTGDFYMEIKYRPDLTSDTYINDLLEYKKMDALRDIDPDATHLYFMLFKDGVGRCYNLSKMCLTDIQIENILCPISSVEDKGYQNKIMVKLPTAKAKIYKWKKD